MMMLVLMVFDVVTINPSETEAWLVKKWSSHTRSWR